MAILSPTELAQKLEDIVQRLQMEFDPIVIYLFGSYAYGTPRSHSDLDLIVIDDSIESVYERFGRAYRALRGIGVPKDVMVYTRQEFEKRSTLKVSFERTVRQKGRLLYAA